MFEEESGKILDRMYGAMVARATADPKQSKAAKLLYMLLALWADCGVKPEEVWKKLQARERFAGLAELDEDDGRG